MSATLLRGARLVGGADAATDLLVVEGRIRAVGVSRHDLFELGRGPAGAVETVDLEGRWVHPGLWDQHVHLTQWGLSGGRLDVSAAASAAEAAAIVRAHVAAEAPPPGEVLVGTGFRDGLWPDAPTAEGLDVGDVPVCLVSQDVHSVWSNRAATLLLGLGEEGWMLREQAAFDLNVRLGDLPPARLDAAVAAAAARAAARGVVGVVDLELEGAPAAWARRFAAGFRTLRVRAGVYPGGLDAALAAGIRSGIAVEGTEGMLVGGAFKLFTDGALGSRTAWCDEPYAGPDGTPTRGIATYDPPELLALSRAGLAHGLVPTIHAIGDAAVALALDTFAELGPAPAGASWRMEHAQLVRDADLPRFAALGVTASVQPRHAIDDRDLADEFWADRTARMYPFRALLDAGAELALGSDAPVAPLDPWLAIAAAVTRTADGRPSWHAEQRLTVAEALAASTDGIAALAAGGPADLVVLDADPLAVPIDDPVAAAVALAAMPVHATMAAGRWTHGPYGG